jgi:two-component system, LuxR family, sensor kinase FixL
MGTSYPSPRFATNPPARPSHSAATTGVYVDLFRAVAHELNQPLASILSNAQAAQHLLGATRVDRDELYAILQDIASQNRRVSETIRRFQLLLKQRDAPLQPVRVDALLDDALALVRDDLLARKIEVRTQLTSALPLVSADRLQILQVLLSLIHNVCDASGVPRQGVEHALEISAGLAGKDVYVSVGSARFDIDTIQLNQMLQSFFASRRGTVVLGLAICRLIIAAHGGCLWPARRTDSGAAFHFTLPILRERR